jgi:hypothetical protein
MNEKEEMLDDIDNMRTLVARASKRKLDRFEIDSMEARLNYLEKEIKQKIEEKEVEA